MKARVKAGRLVLDEPTQLPEGTVVTLRVVNDGDDLGDDLSTEERERLHDALDEAWKSVRAGHSQPASALLNAISSARS